MNAVREHQDALALELRGVAVGALRGGEVPVVTSVDWAVAPGEFWVVGGSHGVGKSDFLLMMAGLTRPQAGDYRLFGEPMPIFEESRLAQRLSLGLVFDGGQLLNHLTVFENVALPLQYHRNPSRAEVEEAVRSALEATGLSAWSASTPGMIPRAWRKRAGLARALMLQPEVLLLDCPLSGLDLRHTDWWLRFLDALSVGHPLLGNRPTTLVVTTEAFRFYRGPARQFALLDNHHFLVLGDWSQVERSPEPAARLLIEGHGAPGPPADPGS